MFIVILLKHMAMSTRNTATDVRAVDGLMGGLVHVGIAVYEVHV